MAIEFTCKNCNSILRVPDEHLGKQARCPKCQTLNIVQPDQPAAAAPPASSFSAPTGPSNAPTNPYANPYAGGHAEPTAPRINQYAMAHRGGLILTLGIIGFFCYCSVVPGLLAWILGASDLKKMTAGTMDPEGRGLTLAGMILGIVTTAILGLVVLIYGAMFVIAVLGAGI